jgi:hypothetical protein
MMRYFANEHFEQAWLENLQFILRGAGFRENLLIAEKLTYML